MLNGTAPATLLKNYSEILEALRTTRNLVVTYSPHGRDYLKIRDYYHDLNMHSMRVKEIDRLISAYMNLAEEVSNQ